MTRVTPIVNLPQAVSVSGSDMVLIVQDGVTRLATVDLVGQADGVTTFSAVGNNGVTVNVTNPTTTPELTIGLSTVSPSVGVLLPAGSAAAPSLAFSADTNTGLYSPAVDTLGFSGAGAEQFRVSSTASAVNRLNVIGQTTGNAPALFGIGSDTDVQLNFSTKGAGNVNFQSDSFTANLLSLQRVASAVNNLRIDSAGTANDPAIRMAGSDTNISFDIFSKAAAVIRFLGQNVEQMRMSPTASAVNYHQLSGSITADYPYLVSQGTDTNVGTIFNTKGNGSHQFRTGNSGANIQMLIAHVASAVNYDQFTGSATGVSVAYSAAGTDANVSLTVGSKGTGHNILTANAALGIRVRGDLASMVNWTDFFGAAAGNAPQMRSEGSDTNPGMVISSKGVGSTVITTGSSARNVISFADSASSVNWWQVNPSATGVGAFLGAAPGSSDTNVQSLFYTKGTGAALFRSGGSSGPDTFQIFSATSAVNFWRAQAEITSNPVRVTSNGTDTNVGINFGSKGSGTIDFRTNGNVDVQMTIAHVGSAVNHMEVIGNVTTAEPRITSQGTDTNVGGVLSTRGTGNWRVMTNGAAQEQLRVVHVASAVNYVLVSGAVTTASPFVSAEGSDANINLTLQGKGNGVVKTAAAFQEVEVTVTYSASMTIDASTGNEQIITATNGTAFTINAPTNPRTGQYLEITIRNTSGGALGVATWNAAFKMTAWTQPANAFSRTITFRYNGANWIEKGRTAADVPN